MAKEAKKIPTLFIEADSVPEAHYKAIEAVWQKGMTKRTQYDTLELNEHGEKIYETIHYGEKDHKFRSKSRNCPFIGWNVKGKVKHTIHSGRVVFSDK